ncbi:putative lipoyltransferase 2, mitochondrial isoform X1 [Phyllopteryx taeniolatus]|uniref:putative lipoyltransferase 2, mitochondrial isoform X1 n=2 Tax=Phyllopteryx taeniolatus TaxID=161469 RepID=UPI002AD534F8|nr:putative lipoyltransferase 2, mitochondrial isoform X1 [Phyllopteryx taeniolatus]
MLLAYCYVTKVDGRRSRRACLLANRGQCCFCRFCSPNDSITLEGNHVQPSMRIQGSLPPVEVVRLGLLSYRQALRVQQAYVKRCQAGAAHALLLCQHPPVYTTGIRQKERPPAELERLRLLGAQVHRADRGGLITFHGPGQLVCYPVLHLASFKKSVRWYVSQLERTVVAACRSFRVEASTSPHTGVWVGDNKICAIGVRCSRYVTSHGLALNCNTDLAWFRHIVPCGVEGKGVTSLSVELRRDVGVDEAVPHVLRAFADVFRCRLADAGAVRS